MTETADTKDAHREYIFAAGKSKRIWNELYKVIDSSDVILQVLDARDPLGNFLTAILLCGLRNCFFSPVHLLSIFGLLHPFSIWTFFLFFFQFFFHSFSIIYFYSIPVTFWIFSKFLSYELVFPKYFILKIVRNNFSTDRTLQTFEITKTMYLKTETIVETSYF